MEFNTEYVKWAKEYNHVLMSLAEKDIFLLFSGGKDSSLALAFITRASKEFGFEFNAHAGAYPVHRYTSEEKERISSYWSQERVEITWYDMEETDEDMKKSPNPCHVCQKVRKKMLNTILSSTIDNWGKLVLIPCFSLWDIVGYSLENILSGIYSSSRKESQPEYIKRFLETSQRFYPIIKMKEGYTVFRPLVKYNGNDILEMVNSEDIPILSIPCQYKDYRPKRLLERYYQKMGMRFAYDNVFAFANEKLNIPAIDVYSSMDREAYIHEVF